MIPIIYPATETSFTSRGYGPLADCTSCVVVEELNGAYTCQITYPKNGLHEDALEVRNIIVCSANHEVERQAFRIYKVNRSLANSIVVYANQISYDLNALPVLPTSVVGIEAAVATLNSAASPFTITTNIPRRGSSVEEPYVNVRADHDTSSEIIEHVNPGDTFDILASYQYGTNPEWWQIKLDRSGITGWSQALYLYATNDYDFVVDVPSGVRSWFGGKQGSLLDLWGGEFEYLNRQVNWLKHRGADNGARISYGVNIAQYIKEITAGCYSAIIPYFAKKDGDTMIERTGSEIATGFTQITKKLPVDVTNQFSENEGKNINMNLGKGQRDKTYSANSASSFPAVGNNVAYIGLYPLEAGAHIDGTHVDVENINSGLTFNTSQAAIGVGVPIQVAPLTRYELTVYDYGSSTNVYIVVVYVDSNGNRIARSGATLVSDGQGLRTYTVSFITAPNTAFAVITPYRSTSGSGTWPNRIELGFKSLISIPPESNITDAGNAWLAKNPQNTDVVTYSIEPEVLATKAALGDTVHISYGSDQVDSRVVKTTWDALTERYTKLEIGTVKQNIAQTIKNLR